MDENSEFKKEAADLANEQLGNTVNSMGKRILGTEDGNSVLNTYEAAIKSKTDPVTGLLNRWVWEDEMNTVYKIAVRNKQSFTVIMMDVDDLKKINDSRGHAAGDLVLNRLGNAILNRFRVSDICGRFGGDEMITMLTTGNLKPDEIEAEENKLYKDLSKNTGNGISVGIGVWDGVSTLEETIKRADGRLYQNKQNKKHV